MGRGPTAKYHKEMMDGYVKGTLTCLAPDYIKNNINTDFPLVLNIEPTNACNLNCYICPRSRSLRKEGYMDFVLYRRIIDECGSYRKLKMINFLKTPNQQVKLLKMKIKSEQARVLDYALHAAGTV